MQVAAENVDLFVVSARQGWEIHSTTYSMYYLKATSNHFANNNIIM